MTTYFFHFQTGPRLILDSEGIDLASPADALERAARLATDLLCEDELACDWSRSAIRVEDQHQRRVFELAMTSVRARYSRLRPRPH